MKILVTTPNRMLVVKGLPVRSPVEIAISSNKEYKFYETYLASQCAEFEIIEESKPKSTPRVQKKIVNKTVETPVETPQLDEDLNVLTADDESTEPVIEELGSGKILDRILTD